MQHADIIDRWGYRLLAKELRKYPGNEDVDRMTVAKWKSRNRIPVSQWGNILKLASKEKISINLQDIYAGYNL